VIAGWQAERLKREGTDAADRRADDEQRENLSAARAVAQDLAEWRMRSGRPADKTLVFPRRDGGSWQDHERQFAAALNAAGVEHAARPYDLRHSFASLPLADGRTIHYVFRQLGHAPSMTLDVYGHMTDELEDRDRLDAEMEIRAARESVVPFRRQPAGISTASPLSDSNR
jgi:integrase